MTKMSLDGWTAMKIGVSEEDLSQEVLEQYQLREIRKAIHYTKEHSDFYREHLKEFEPDGILTMKDFQKLPFTSEANLVGQEWRFQCISAKDVSRVVTVPTTGTLGNRKRIAFSKKDLQLAHAFAPAGFAAMCSPGDRVAVMMSGNSEGSIGDSVKKGLLSVGVEAYAYGIIEDLHDAEHFLRFYRPDVIVGIPSQMAVLERYMRNSGLFQLKSLLLSADDVPEALCVRLRNAWKCNTYRHYGMTELCMFGAVECHAASGYHMRSADHLFEVLNPDEEGYGEIVVTTFHHEAMPLLRYRTGDIGCMLSSPCDCGSPLFRIGKIKGRINNSIEFPNGRLFLRDIAEIVFSDLASIDFECITGKNDVLVVVKAMTGDIPDIEWMKRQMMDLPVMKDVSVVVRCEITDGLPDNYKVKKRMNKNEDIVYNSISVSSM